MREKKSACVCVMQQCVHLSFNVRVCSCTTGCVRGFMAATEVLHLSNTTLELLSGSPFSSPSLSFPLLREQNIDCDVLLN